MIVAIGMRYGELKGLEFPILTYVLGLLKHKPDNRFLSGLVLREGVWGEEGVCGGGRRERVEHGTFCLTSATSSVDPLLGVGTTLTSVASPIVEACIVRTWLLFTSIRMTATLRIHGTT